MRVAVLGAGGDFERNLAALLKLQSAHDRLKVVTTAVG